MERDGHPHGAHTGSGKDSSRRQRQSAARHSLENLARKQQGKIHDLQSKVLQLEAEVASLQVNIDFGLHDDRLWCIGRALQYIDSPSQAPPGTRLRRNIAAHAPSRLLAGKAVSQLSARELRVVQKGLSIDPSEVFPYCSDENMGSATSGLGSNGTSSGVDVQHRNYGLERCSGQTSDLSDALHVFDDNSGDFRLLEDGGQATASASEVHNEFHGASSGPSTSFFDMTGLDLADDQVSDADSDNDWLYTLDDSVGAGHGVVNLINFSSEDSAVIEVTSEDGPELVQNLQVEHSSKDAERFGISDCDVETEGQASSSQGEAQHDQLSLSSSAVIEQVQVARADHCDQALETGRSGWESAPELLDASKSFFFVQPQVETQVFSPISVTHSGHFVPEDLVRSSMNRALAKSHTRGLIDNCYSLKASEEAMAAGQRQIDAMALSMHECMQENLSAVANDCKLQQQIIHEAALENVQTISDQAAGYRSERDKLRAVNDMLVDKIKLLQTHTYNIGQDHSLTPSASMQAELGHKNAKSSSSSSSFIAAFHGHCSVGSHALALAIANSCFDWISGKSLSFSNGNAYYLNHKTADISPADSIDAAAAADIAEPPVSSPLPSLTYDGDDGGSESPSINSSPFPPSSPSPAPYKPCRRAGQNRRKKKQLNLQSTVVAPELSASQTRAAPASALTLRAAPNSSGPAISHLHACTEDVLAHDS